MIRRVYKIKPINHWPYHEAVSVSVLDDESPIPIDLDQNDCLYRIYRRHPTQCIEWALVDIDHFFGDHETLATDPMRLQGPSQQPWLRTSFTLFCSDYREDEELLSPLRDRLAASGLKSLRLPSGLVLTSFAVEGTGSKVSVPQAERHTEGDFEQKRIRQLYVSDSRQRKYPILNEGTIPDKISDEFEFVAATVTIFEPIEKLPTIGDMVRSAEEWCKWFDTEFGVLTATVSALNG